MEEYTISDTISAMRREANTFNYVSLFFGLLTLTFVWGAGGQSTGIYADYKVIFWITSFVLVFAGLFVPLNKAKYLPYGKRFYWIGFIMLGALFIYLSVAVCMLLIPDEGTQEMSQKAIDMIGYSVAAGLVVLGWFVQHQLNLQHNKTNHSLNALLQMRVSEEFQAQTRKANRYFPSRNNHKIPPEIVKSYYSKDIDLSKEDDLKKIKSISSHSYLLNYYEFLAFGIKSGSLDEELLFQTLGGVITGHMERAEAMIDHARKDSIKVFVNLVELGDRWKERRAFDCLKLEAKKKKNEKRAKTS